MKRLLLFIVSLGLLASCAPQKYAYHFGTHDYYAGKRKQVVEQGQQQIAAIEVATQQEELKVSSNELTASTETKAVAAENNVMAKAKEIATKYQTLKADPTVSNRELRKELKSDVKALKKDLKKFIKEKKSSPTSVEETNSIDKNLKLALIFFVAALIATIFSYILGGILWIIGLVFLIMWLVEL